MILTNKNCHDCYIIFSTVPERHWKEFAQIFNDKIDEIATYNSQYGESKTIKEDVDDVSVCLYVNIIIKFILLRKML